MNHTEEREVDSTYPNEHSTARRHEAQQPRPLHLLAHHDASEHGNLGFSVCGVDGASRPGAHGRRPDGCRELEFFAENVEEEVPAECVLHLQSYRCSHHATAMKARVSGRSPRCNTSETERKGRTNLSTTE